MSIAEPNMGSIVTPDDVSAELLRIQTTVANLREAARRGMLTDKHIEQIERLYHQCGHILAKDFVRGFK